jgi:hypothetical protein
MNGLSEFYEDDKKIHRSNCIEKGCSPQDRTCDISLYYVIISCIIQYFESTGVEIIEPDSFNPLPLHYRG